MSDRRKSNQTGRRTIALVVNNLATSNNQGIWAGVRSATQALDVNLFCLTGEGRLSGAGSNTQSDVLHGLASPESIDGVITWGSSYRGVADQEDFQTLVTGLHPLPIVDIGHLNHTPRVQTDDYQNTRAALLHLLEEHGHKRIAFVRGPAGSPEAQARYRAYVDVLAEKDIALDPLLVCEGQFEEADGERAVEQLLDDRKVGEIDALVASNDYMAIGALNALQARGLQVPGDVAVVGYDDVEEAQLTVPGMTTVRQPLYDMGQRAVEMLLAILDGQDVPDEVIMPGQLITRQSCGCLSPAVVQAGESPVAEKADERGPKAFQQNRDAILANMLESGEKPALDPTVAGPILDGFAQVLWDDVEQDCIACLRGIFHDRSDQQAALEAGRRSIAALHRYVFPYVDDSSWERAVTLLNQARTWINERLYQTEAHRVLEIQDHNRRLHAIGSRLNTTFDTGELTDILAEELPRLGITSCYVSLYETDGPTSEMSNLILAYDQDGRVDLDADGWSFPTRRLLPDRLRSQKSVFDLTVLPLHFGNTQLGFALLEIDPSNGAICVPLQGQISSGLQGARNLSALEQAYAVVEQRVQERTAQLEHEMAERKQAEAALRESEERLRNIVEQSGDGIALIDEQGKIVEWNRKQETITGLKKAEVVGRDVWEVQYQLDDKATRDPEVHAQMKVAIQHLLETGGAPWLDDYQDAVVHRPDGTTRDTQAVVFPIKTRKGIMIGSVTRDITEHKQAEDALRVSEQRYRAIAEMTADNIYSYQVHPDGTAEVDWFIHDAFTRLSGYELGELEDTFDLYHPEDRQAIRQDIERVIAGEACDGDYRIITKSGEQRWVQVQRRPVWDAEQKRVIRFYGATRDITERKLAEQALIDRESNTRRFREQLETLHTVSAALGATDSLDEFCRLTVELGREQLGFDRMGLWLYDAETDTLQGMFGTDTQGQTLDERQWRLPADAFPIERSIVSGDKHLILHNPATITSASGELLGDGWYAQVALWHGEAVYGYLCADNLLNQQSLQPHQMELLSIYGTAVGNLYARKQSEIALRESEMRYRAISETVADYAYSMRVTEEGVLEREWTTATAFTRITGYASGELLDFFELYHPDDRDRARRDVEIVRSGQPVSEEYRLITNSGELRWVQVDRRPVETDDETNGTRYHAAARDITARKQAEEALRVSEKRYRAISELVSDYAYSYRTSTDGELVNEWITEDALQRITGFTADEVATIPSIFHPDDQERVRNDVERVMTGEKGRNEYRIVTKGGDIRWVQVIRRPTWDANRERVIGFYGATRDVTESRLAEEALRESEERHRIVSEIVSDHAFVNLVNPDGTTENEWYTQDALSHVTGYDRPNIWQEIDVLFHPEDRERLRTDVARVQAGETTSGEYRIITKGGETRWLQISRQPVWDEDQKRVIRYYGATSDITPRKQAEEALRESEERHRAISETVSDYAYAMRLMEDGEFEFEWLTGAAFQRITGYQFEEIQTSFDKLFHPDDLQKVREDHAKVLAGEAVNGAYRILTKDGVERWIQVHRRPVWNQANSQVIRFYGAASDVTARKQAEEALRASEDRYRGISESVSDYADSYRVHEDGTVEREWVMEAAFARITGYDVDEIASFDIYHPDERDVVLENVQKVREGQATQGEHRIITKSGETRWLQIDRRPVWDEAQNRVVRYFSAARDITDRKQAEEALRESEERHRAVSEMISDYAYSYRINEDGTITSEWITPTDFAPLAGYNPNELADPFDMYHPDDRERARQDMQQVLEGTPSTGEYRVVTKSGDIRWFQIDRKPGWDEEAQRVTRYLAAARNITERKRAEANLRVAEQRYRALFERTNDAVFIIAMDGTYLEVNQQAADMLGYHIDELVGTVGTNYLAPGEKADAESRQRAILAGEILPVYERVFQRKDGSTFTGEINIALAYDEQGKPSHFHSIIRDISERKQAEEALRQSEDRYRIISEILSDYAYSNRLNDDGIFENDWIVGHEAYKRITGYKHGEVRNIVRQLIHPDDRESLNANHEALLAGETVSGEYRIINKHGERRWIQIFTRPVWDEEEQKVVRYHGAISDITERKQAEEALQASEDRYRAISETVADYAYSARFNPDESIEFEWLTEDAYYRITGYHFDELRDDVNKLAHPDDLERFERDHARVKIGETSSGEYRIFTKSGEMRWLQIDRKPVWDETEQRVVRFFGAARDITARKRAEQALRESEERFYKAFQTSPDAVTISHLDDGVFIDVNPGFSRMVGYSKEEAVNKSTLDLKIWVDPNVRKQLVAGLRQHREISNLEAEYRRKDGSTVVGLMSAGLIDIQDETCLLTITRDISERKEMEESLRVSEERYRAISESVSDYAFSHRLDDDGNLVNEWVTEEAFYRITGYTHKEAWPPEKLFHPDELDGLKQDLAKVMGGEATDAEYRIVTKGGDQRWLQITRRPLRDGEGQVVGFYGAARDVSDRKNAEAALRASEDRYRIISETVSDYAYSDRIHPDGTLENEWITEDAYYRITGYTFHEAKAEENQIYHPDDWAILTQDLVKVIAGEATSGEYRLITKSGEQRWVQITRRPYWDEKEQRVTRFYGAVSDITERKLTQEALKASEDRYRVISGMISDYAYSYRVTPEGTFEGEWSTEDAFTRMAGYGADEVVNTFELYHPGDQERVRQDVEKTMSGEPTSAEYRIVTKDGDLRWLQIDRKPEWDETEQRVVRFFGAARDITARKQAEEALRESEERYRAVSEMISDNAFSWRVNPDGSDEQEWTTAAISDQGLGYSPGDLEDPLEMYHPEDRDRAQQDIEKVRAGEPTSGEYRIITKSGEIRWRRIDRKPVWNDDKQRVVRFYGAAKDITDRKEAEDALRVSEERYRAVSESVSDYAFSTRVAPDGSTEHEWITEDAYFRITGYYFSELGDFVDQIYHPEDKERGRQAIEKVVAGEPSSGEFRLITKSGKIRWVQIDRRPIWDDKKTRVIRYLGGARDITERKQAEEALRVSEERHRTISEMISDYAFSVRIDPDGNHVLDWATYDAYARMVGYKMDEIVGFQLYHPDDRERAERDTDRVINGEPYSGEYRVITKSGETRWLQIDRRPVWNAEKTRVIRYWGGARDITERKQAEEALRLSEDRYRIISETVSDYAFSNRVEPDGTIENEWITDDAYYRISGYHFDEIQDHIGQFYHPDDQEVVQKDLASVVTGEPTGGEYRIITKSGETRWLQIDRQPVWDNDQQRVIRFDGAARDITERKQAEEAVQRSEALLRALLNATIDVALLTSASGEILILNEAFANRMSGTIDDMVGKNVVDLLDSDIQEDRQRRFDQVRETCQPMRWEDQTNTGWWDNSIFPVLSPAGVVEAFAVYARNVTARKEAEEALRASEERYRAISESVSDYAYSTRIDEDGTVENEWITEEALYRITGYHFDELRHSLDRLSHPEDLEKLNQDHIKTIAGEPTTGEYRFITKGGETRWLQVTRRPVWDDQQNRVIRFYGAASDITERKQAEEALRESEERYRAVTEVVSDYAYSYRITADGDYVDEWMTEDAFFRVTGYRYADARKNIERLYEPEDWIRLRQSLDQLNAGKATSGEYRLITKDGTTRWLQINEKPVWDEEREQIVRYYGAASDITERKRAEEALRQSEDRYRAITEVVSDYAYSNRITADGNYVDEWMTEEAFFRVTGYRYADVRETIDRLYEPEDWNRLLQSVKQLIAGEDTSGEYQLITKSGERRWLQINEKPVWDEEENRVIRYYGAASDITERKRAEEALRASEDRYRAITETVSDFAFANRVNPDGTLDNEWVTDDSFYRITGYHHDEVWPGPRQMYHPDDVGRLIENRDQVIAGEPTSGQHRIITKSGDIRWLQIDQRPVWDEEQNRVIRFYGGARDITERKQAEEALRASEERFYKAFQTSSDAISINHVEDGAYFDINQGFTELTGYSKDEVLTKTSVDIHIWNDPRDLDRLTQALNQHGEVSNMEAEFRRKDGMVWVGLMSAKIIDIVGETCVLSMTRDITERRNARREREKLIEELESKNAELERFTYTVSHDLKSPLITIQGFLGFLDQAARDGDIEQVEQDMARITNAVGKMQQLMDELLELSRIGRLVNPPEEVLFEDLAQEAVEMVEGQLSERGVTVEIASDLPMVYGDRVRLQEVLENLVSNAVKFMGKQTAPEITVGMRHDGDEQVFFVQDNGIGIDPRYHDTVFGLFNKLSSHGEGTGIGLAIVKRIVEVHGGRIWVESAGEGQGSTFCFTLPESKGN